MSVFVLQHPDESRINKGSAIIAKLSLINYQCWQGEDFTQHDELNQLIKDSAAETVVIYPDQKAVALSAYGTEICSEMCTDQKIKNLILIDATWRKAKKIWSLSTNLQALTSLKLEADIKSNYRIRKVPEDGYLSTVEAISYSLSYLDPLADNYQPMLKLFDSMIDYQIDKMGQTTYDKNYTSKK